MKTKKIEIPSNKSFGLFFAALFFAGACYSFFHGLALGLTVFLFIVSAVLFTLAVANPQLLTPFNKLWMRLGLVMGSIASPVIMAIIYLFIFVPVGLSMKLFGRDELKLKRDPTKGSFWVERDFQKNSEFSFKRQF